jgi:hypothetical protein
MRMWLCSLWRRRAPPDNGEEPRLATLLVIIACLAAAGAEVCSEMKQQTFVPSPPHDIQVPSRSRESRPRGVR